MLSLPGQKYSQNFVKWNDFFLLVWSAATGSLRALFFILISLIGFSTGIISAHCIYATNVGLWSHLEHVSQVAIEIVTFACQEEQTTAIYFGPLKILEQYVARKFIHALYLFTCIHGYCIFLITDFIIFMALKASTWEWMLKDTAMCWKV